MKGVGKRRDKGDIFLPLPGAGSSGERTNGIGTILLAMYD
jgi:hypothetical protein